MPAMLRIYQIAGAIQYAQCTSVLLNIKQLRHIFETRAIFL